MSGAGETPHGKEELLSSHIPHRLTALDGLATAMAMLDPDVLHTCESQPIVQQSVFGITNQQQQYSCAIGSRLVTNALIDAGLTHCRVLLEFLGVGRDREDKSGSSHKLKIGQSQLDDITLEQIGGRRLDLMDVRKCAQASLLCDDNPPTIEWILSYIIYLANKGVAHLTRADIGGQPGHVLTGVFFIELAIEVLVYRANTAEVPQCRHWSQALLCSNHRARFEDCRATFRSLVTKQLPHWNLD